MANEYSLADVLERIYHNKPALEAALMEVTLWAERKNAAEVGENVRGRFTQLVKMLITSNKAWRGSKDWIPRNKLQLEAQNTPNSGTCPI